MFYNNHEICQEFCGFLVTQIYVQTIYCKTANKVKKYHLRGNLQMQHVELVEPFLPSLSSNM